MQPGDIIVFTDKARSLAGMFCSAYGLTGVVLATKPNYLIRVAGLPYEIHAAEDELALVVSHMQIPAVDCEE